MSLFKKGDRVKAGKFRGKVDNVIPNPTSMLYNVTDGKENKPYWEGELRVDTDYYEDREKRLKELLDKS